MFQIATLVLLLACMHLSLGAAVGAMPRRAVPVEREGEAFWCSHGIVANQTDIIRKIRKEATIVIRIVQCLLGIKCHDAKHTIVGLKENGECEPVVLPPPPYPALNSTLQSTANAFWNLSHLLQMYRSVWRMMELHEGYSNESEAAKLDMLEIVFSRFSYQVERYLQVNRCSCNGTNCTLHQDINKESVQEVLQREFCPAGCSRKLLLGKIITSIETEAKSIYSHLTHHNVPRIFTPWPVCATIKANPIQC